MEPDDPSIIRPLPSPGSTLFNTPHKLNEKCSTAVHTIVVVRSTQREYTKISINMNSLDHISNIGCKSDDMTNYGSILHLPLEESNHAKLMHPRPTNGSLPHKEKNHLLYMCIHRPKPHYHYKNASV